MDHSAVQFIHDLLTTSPSVNEGCQLVYFGLENVLGSTTLRIIETTDLHMQLSGYDYLRDQPNPNRGLARLAPKITALRDEGITSLLFDNGDFLQGTPLADTAMQNLRDGIPHPMISALNDLKYDAITLGNHEFDYGLDDLARALDGCNMPVVSANVRTSPTTHLVPPWTIIARELRCEVGAKRSLKIGVIGFVAPQISEWNKHLLGDSIITDDIVSAAKTHVSAMRRAGADIVVALCHAGLEATTHTLGMENAAGPLAALLGIDVVLSGHTHNFFPGEMFPQSTVIDTKAALVFGKPLVMAGFDGLALGVIDLGLVWEDDRWAMTGHKTQLIYAKDIPEDANHQQTKSIMRSIAVPHTVTRKIMSTEIARTQDPLSSHFTMIGVDPTVSLVAYAHMHYARKILEDESYGDIPVLGSVASFRAGGHGGAGNFLDIPKGPIVNRDIGAMVPFNNPICAVLRRGWQLRRWLEYTAGYFLKINPGIGAQPIICPRFPSYHFDWLVGLTYSYDLTVPARFNEVGDLIDDNAYRIKDLCYKGKPVEDDDLFVVATSVYRAHGGGGQNAVQPQDILETSTKGAADILATFLANSSGITAPLAPVWDFAPIEGARGVFRTSPAAKDGQMPHGVERLAGTPDGFDAYAYSF